MILNFAFRYLTRDQGEIFKQTKERLEKRTGLKGKQFEKIKFALVSRTSFAKPTYLDDGEPSNRTYF